MAEELRLRERQAKAACRSIAVQASRLMDGKDSSHVWSDQQYVAADSLFNDALVQWVNQGDPESLGAFRTAYEDLQGQWTRLADIAPTFEEKLTNG